MLNFISQIPLSKQKLKSAFFFACFFILTNNLLGQDKNIPVLERDITILAQDKTIEYILADVSNQAGITFSYNPEAIGSNRVISINIKQKPVRMVLIQLFNNEVEFKSRGKYIILKRVKKDVDKEPLKLEGYIYDSKTGEKLIEASIYDKNLNIAAITNDYGYFNVEVPANQSLPELKVSKSGYSDTALIVNSQKESHSAFEISLNAKDSIEDKKWKSFINLEKITPKWLIPKKIKANALNINDSVFRTVQLSLIPYLTTNHFVGGNVVNNISINATVGYIKGVRWVEFGGILNIDQDDASFCQFGGVGNIVGRNLKGIQAGGVFNYASNAKGAQFAGIFNLSGDANFQFAGTFNFAEENNIQASGVFNYAENSNLQVSGIFNNSKGSNVQVSGVFNRAKKSNVQVSGTFNIADTVNTQVAPIFNHAVYAEGAQVSGVWNNANENATTQVAGIGNYVNGEAEIQISSVVNIAKQINKLQIGFFNIVDSCLGVPIGLFSVVKSGYHKIEVSGDEILPVNLAFRSGITKFHTFISAGINPFKHTQPLFSYGYGIGSSFVKNEKTMFDIDLSFHNIVYAGHFDNSGFLGRLYFGLDKKLLPKMSIAFGLTYNLFISDTQSPYYDVYSKISSYTLTNSTNTNGINLKSWFGGKIGLRFF